MPKKKFKVGDKVIIDYKEDWARRDLQGVEAVIVRASGSYGENMYEIDWPGRGPNERVLSSHLIYESNLKPAENGLQRAVKIIRKK